jgi:hypothetical protein
MMSQKHTRQLQLCGGLGLALLVATACGGEEPGDLEDLEGLDSDDQVSSQSQALNPSTGFPLKVIGSYYQTVMVHSIDMRLYNKSQIYTAGQIRTEVKLRGKEFAVGMVKINGTRVWFKVRTSNDSKDYVRYFKVPKGASVVVGERKGSIKSVHFIPGGSGSSIPLNVVKTYPEEVIPIPMRFRIYDTSTVKHDGWAEAVVKLRGTGSSGGLGVVNVNGKWLAKTAVRAAINNTLAKHPIVKYYMKTINYDDVLESSVELDGMPAAGAIKVNGTMVWKHFPVNENTHTYTTRVYLPAKGALHVGEYHGSIVGVRGAYSHPYRLRHTKTGQYMQRLSQSVGLRPWSSSLSQRVEVWTLCDGSKKIKLYKTHLCLTDTGGGSVGLRSCGLDYCKTTYFLGNYHTPPKTAYTPTTPGTQRWKLHNGRLRSVSRHDRYLAASSSWGGLHLTTYAPGTSTKKCIYNYHHQPINCYTVKSGGKNEAITAWSFKGF